MALELTVELYLLPGYLCLLKQLWSVASRAAESACKLTGSGVFKSFDPNHDS